ncbi:MAG: hypothetical protein FJ291_29160 [Planctomycetes bacterium]|nr:hypothetical protein [Planctomycetota bacterium]
MRWSIVLESPSVSALAPEPLQLGPDPDGRRASVAIEASDAGLQFTATAEGRPGLPRPPYPEWYFRDHLVVFLNPGHDHATRWLYAVDDAGAVVREAAWIAPGEEPGDHPSRALPEPPAAEGEFRRLGDGRFWARLRWSVALPSQPLGVKIKVGFHEEVVPRPLVWPQQPAWMDDLPLSFGDLVGPQAGCLCHQPLVVVKSLEFREPAWGGEPSLVVMRMAVAPGGPQEGLAEVVTILPEDSEQAQPPVAWRAGPSGIAEVALPVVFPHRAKWASDVRLTARLRLTIRDGGGQTLWAAEYPFGFDCGIIVRERYGARVSDCGLKSEIRNPKSEMCPRPAPSAPDFLDRHRAYILSRLPDYRRRTTREGEPSDFFLEDARGGEHLDLMAADALDQAAAMLARRFPDWQDALAAAALWAYHPSITRHSSSWSVVASQAAVGTIPRVNGCFCGDVARLVAALAEKVGERLGLPLRGYTLGLRGHLSTLVETPLGRVVLDGMLGHAYLTLDNTRLATLDEMRANGEIVCRLWYCPRAHGHEFYLGVRNQILQPWREGPLAFPSPSHPEAKV